MRIGPVDRALLNYLFRAPAARHFALWHVAHQFDLPCEHIDARLNDLTRAGLVREAHTHNGGHYVQITQTGRNKYLDCNG